MKRVLSLLICIMVLMTLVLSTSAFSTIQVKSIKLDQTSASLKVGSTLTLKVAFTPANTTQRVIKYSTSNSSIAKVDSKGKVTALKPGKATITVTSASNSKVVAKCAITVAESVNPLQKYSPAIKMTVGRSIDDGNKFADGTDFNNNKWRNYMVAHTGVDSNVIWAVPQAQYDSKVNVVIASGDIPDLMKVSGSQLQNLAEAGMIQEMGSSITKWQSDKLKATIAGDPVAIKSATIDGKVMALPIPGSPSMAYQFLNYRADWFTKLGLPVPKTADEFMKAAQEFAKQNPDEAKQTFGLGLCKDLFGPSNSIGGFATLEGFFSMYHSYPTIWVKDAKGNAVWGGIQADVKPVLQKLQDMYKAGLIDKEFAVKDSSKVSEDLNNGMIGMVFGQWWNPYWPINTAVAKNTKADWKAALLPSVDSKTAQSVGQFPTQGYWVVKKGYKNPEALVRMVNFILDYNYVNTKGYDWNVYNDEINKNGTTWWVQGTMWFEPPTKNADICVGQYLPAWSKYQKNPNGTFTADEKSLIDVLNGWNAKKDAASWPAWAAFGPGSTLDLTGNILMKNQDKYIAQTLFNSTPTQAMIDNVPALYNLQLQTYTKIIMGNPISDFDKFVDQWKKAGGDAVTKDANSWYQSHK